jgi:hypothetical protein
MRQKQRSRNTFELTHPLRSALRQKWTSMILPGIIAAAILLVGCSRDALCCPEIIDPINEAARYEAKAVELARSTNLLYQNFAVFSNGAYYIGMGDEGLFRLSSATNKREKIDARPGSYLSIQDDWIFYVSGSLGDAVHKIMTDKTNSVRISTQSFHSLMVDGDWLYGIITSTGQVVRMKTDGTQQESLFDGFAREMLFDGPNIYVCGSEDLNGLVQIDPDTGTATRLLSQTVSSLNKVEDRFYFADPTDQYRVYTWSIGDSEPKKLSDRSMTHPFMVYDGWFFFLDTDNQCRLCRVPISEQKLDTDQLYVIVDDVVQSFLIFPDSIFYRRPHRDTVYRVPLDGGKPVPIS